MFICGIRGRNGIVVSIVIATIWALYLLIIVWSSILVSLIAVAITLLSTAIAATLLFRLRESLRFGNMVAREFAFPTSKASGNFTLYRQVSGVIVFFIPSATLLILKPDTLDAKELYIYLPIGYFVGMLAVLGLMFRFISNVRGYKPPIETPEEMLDNFWNGFK